MRRLLLCLLLAALPALTLACGEELDVSFNREQIDLGAGGWVEGAPDEAEVIHLINDGDSTVWVRELSFSGDAADAYEVSLTRDVEYPYDLSSSVASELHVTFVGEAASGQEAFDAELVAVLSLVARGGRQTRLSVPILLELECDLDGDGDPFTGCGGGDCDEFDYDRSSLQAELCDGQDNDCVGGADADPLGEVDEDHDDWLSCDDCDDDDLFTYPGAAETCDGHDNDCNGEADFDEAGEVNLDGDDWLSCEDCDDSDASVGPFDCR
jgi:hypothetical protein